MFMINQLFSTKHHTPLIVIEFVIFYKNIYFTFNQLYNFELHVMSVYSYRFLLLSYSNLLIWWIRLYSFNHWHNLCPICLQSSIVSGLQRYVRRGGPHSPAGGTAPSPSRQSPGGLGLSRSVSQTFHSSQDHAVFRLVQEFSRQVLR